MLLPSERQPRRAEVSYDPEHSRWGLGDFVVSLAIYFVVGLGVVLALFALDNAQRPQGAALLLAVIAPQAAQLLHLLWVTRTKGVSLSHDFRFAVVGSDLGLGFGLFVAGLVGATVTAVVVTAIVGDPPVATAVDVARDLGGGGIGVGLIVFAVLGATFVPIVEELVFRGLAWSALEKRGTNPWVTLVVTSAVFAALHLEPWRTPVLFVLGLALGYGRMRTGRLGPCIVTHMLINGLALTATLFTIA